MDKPVYDFEEAIDLIKNSETLQALSEHWMVIKKGEQHYSYLEYLELEERCGMKARMLFISE